MKIFRNRFWLLPILAIVFTACNGSSGNDSAIESGSIPIVEENPYGASAVEPPGPDDVVLTVNVRGLLNTFSMSQLAALPVTDLQLFEPFMHQNTQFTGVAMSDIFKANGIVASDVAITVALNDYKYSNNAENFISSNAVIAYQQNGQNIPMDRGGPIRIVFPDGAELSKVLDAWNWSIFEIVIE